MDKRVSARINLHLAQAAYKVAELEALEKQTPSTAATSNTRLSLARRLRSARALENSWSVALGLVAGEKISAEDAGLNKEFQPAPERVVGWVRYQEDTDNDVACNRLTCKNGKSVGDGKWTAVRHGDSDSLRCDWCRRELSA